MTTHPSPFHRQRQPNKTLDPNSDTARFLYTILDQLELKNINWNKVAHNLNITNGHAARMRWSRFKAQLEGVDNSYARRNNKKPVAPRKRKSSKVDRQRSYGQAQIYDETATKRIKTHTDGDMKMENTMGSALGYSGQVKYDTTSAEATRRTSTINGVNIHHPTVTFINTTPSKPPFFPTRLDAASNISGNSQYQTSNYVPHLSNNQTHGTPSSQATHRWQQRFPSSPYTYGLQRPSMAPPLYSTTPNVYHNPYGNPYPQMYDHNRQATSNQLYPQERFTPTQFYRRVDGMAPSISTPPLMQRPRGLADQSLNLNRPNTTNGKVPSSVESQAPTQDHNLTFPNTTASDQTSAQVQALELATQASYPWPHSEASIPQFMRGAIEPDANTPTPKRLLDTANRMANDGHQGHGAINANSTESSSHNTECVQDKSMKDAVGHNAGTAISSNIIDGGRNGIKAASNTVIVKTQPTDEESVIPHIKIEADVDGLGIIAI